MFSLYSVTMKTDEMQSCAKLKVFKLLTYFSGLFFFLSFFSFCWFPCLPEAVDRWPIRGLEERLHGATGANSVYDC